MTLTNGPTFLDTLIATAVKMAKPGKGVTWRQVEAKRTGGAAISDGQYASVWAERSTVMAALAEAGLLVVPVTERYFDPASAYDSGLVYATDELVRFLPYPGVGPGVGFHVAEDSSDPLWDDWRRFQMRKFGGGVQSQAEQALDAAAIDGNLNGAKAVLAEGFAAAAPHDTNEKIKTVLATTAPRLLADTYKGGGKTVVVLTNPDGES
jgi:hypothetical protein